MNNLVNVIVLGSEIPICALNTKVKKVNSEGEIHNVRSRLVPVKVKENLK